MLFNKYISEVNVTDMIGFEINDTLYKSINLCENPSCVR